MAKTKEFKMVVGVDAGYEGQVAGVAGVEVANMVASKWQDIAAKVFSETGVYIGAVVNPAAVVYHQDWGCPVGGERIVKIEGAANPQFTEDIDKWQDAVIKIAKALKKELKQSTVSVTFQEVDFVYLAD